MSREEGENSDADSKAQNPVRRNNNKSREEERAQIQIPEEEHRAIAASLLIEPPQPCRHAPSLTAALAPSRTGELLLLRIPACGGAWDGEHRLAWLLRPLSPALDAPRQGARAPPQSPLQPPAVRMCCCAAPELYEGYQLPRWEGVGGARDEHHQQQPPGRRDAVGTHDHG